MSILIKDMDMPKEGEEHRIIIHHNGQVIIDKRTYYEESEAIQIPTPHGRLIEDIKKIIAHISPHMIIAQTDYEQVERAEAVKKWMLTILEAEE